MAKINEIWPKRDGNLAVLGLYPYKIPEEVRSKICHNTDNFYIMMQNEKLFLLIETADEAEANRRIEAIEDKLSYWIVHPVKELVKC